MSIIIGKNNEEKRYIIDRLLVFIAVLLIILTSCIYWGILSSFEIPVFQDVEFKSISENVSVIAGFESIGPFIPDKKIQLIELQIDLGQNKTKKIHIVISPLKEESRYVPCKVDYNKELWFWADSRFKFTGKNVKKQYISFKQSGEQPLICKIKNTWTENNNEWIPLSPQNNITIISQTSPEAMQFRGFKYKTCISLLLAIFTILPGMSSLRNFLLNFWIDRETHKNTKSQMERWK